MSWLIFALIFWVGAWALNAALARSRVAGTRAVRIFVPVLFGVTLLVLWEGLVRGLGVSPVILPPPSAVAQTFAGSTDILWQDFSQTVFKGALTGFLIGSFAAFATAVVIDGGWYSLVALLLARGPVLAALRRHHGKVERATAMVLVLVAVAVWL